MGVVPEIAWLHLDRAGRYVVVFAVGQNRDLIAPLLPTTGILVDRGAFGHNLANSVARRWRNHW